VLQPAVVELEKDHLVAFCRPGGGFEARTDRYVLRSESHDGGWTWTRAENTEFPNSNTAVDLLKLRNGHLLLVYNDSMTRRTPLTVAISSDGGRTFTHRKNIAEGADSYAYPYAVQARDGKIHVVATSERRTVIARYSFDESAVLGP
jgi:predicted neuraminidase